MEIEACCFLCLIELPTNYYDDFHFSFARHSTLSHEYYEINKKVYFFNPENRDLESFPEKSVILNSHKNLIELQNIL